MVADQVGTDSAGLVVADVGNAGTGLIGFGSAKVAVDADQAETGSSGYPVVDIAG